MSKKNGRWWASICGWPLALSLMTPFLSSCDRGASDQIGAARKFADAVVRNNVTVRDTMIATEKFKEYFNNAYVGHDIRQWFGTFYDYKEGHFSGASSADVDRDLKHDLEGALIDTTEIEETGVVKVKPKDATVTDEAAYFWMVHQRGKPWRVAVVTKGETRVNFK